MDTKEPDIVANDMAPNHERSGTTANQYGGATREFISSFVTIQIWIYYVSNEGIAGE